MPKVVEMLKRFGGRNLILSLPDTSRILHDSSRNREVAAARLRAMQMEIDVTARHRVPFPKKKMN